jgi:hypothetical protein
MANLPTTSKWVRLTELHPKFVERLEHFFNDPRIKNKCAIVSGCRTYAQQKELYRKYRAGTGNLAANPDRRFGPNGKYRGSWHLEQEDGFAYAADLRIIGKLSWATLHAVAKEYGIWKTVPSENWHMQSFGYDYTTKKYNWFAAPAMEGKETKSLTRAKAPEKPKQPEAKAMPLVKRGSRGAHVKIMQQKLTALGFRVSRNPKKPGIDGIAGSMTIAALKRFQKSRGLKVDGYCGRNTWKALGL